MKILVLAPQWPDPPRQGAAIRNLHILLYLAQRHDVTLLTFTPEGGIIDRSRLDSLSQAEILPAPTRSSLDRFRTLLTSTQPDMAWRLHSPLMQERVRQLTTQDHFDAIHVEGIEMVPYSLLAQGTQNSKLKTMPSNEVKGQNSITYDAHNAEYLLQRRAFTTDLGHFRRWPKALYSLVQWWRLRRFEMQACLRSAHILAVSESDKAALARLTPRAADRITLLPNGVDTAYWSLSAHYPREGIPLPDGSLVFDGTMDFRPNVDAVVWFVGKVWPLIKAERPETQFFIVGRSPAPQVRALANVPGVTVTGAVEDPRAWVAQASVYVVPMRMGGGVRLKVLQAMAMERAIVSTPMGAEGVAVGRGKEMLLAQSPAAFANATLSLLADPQRRAAIGRAARELVWARYTWSVLLPVLDNVYLTASSR